MLKLSIITTYHIFPFESYPSKHTFIHANLSRKKKKITEKIVEIQQYNTVCVLHTFLNGVLLAFWFLNKIRFQISCRESGPSDTFSYWMQFLSVPKMFGEVEFFVLQSYRVWRQDFCQKTDECLLSRCLLWLSFYC